MTQETANEMTQFGEIEVVRNVTLPFIIIPADGVPFYMKFNTAIEPDKTTFSERVRKLFYRNFEC
jgi:elongation factor P hydroxylase